MNENSIFLLSNLFSERLEILFLKSNKIKEILKDTFTGLSNLKSFSHNNIQSINKDSFSKFKIYNGIPGLYVL